MAASRLQPTVEHLRRLVGALTGDRRPDRELLNAFASRHDEGAFTTLVGRHGRLVLAACLRILRNEQDAEDAFQATFLVLARKAGAVRWRESVSTWLYHVAVRVSMKLRNQQARRRTRPLDANAEPPAPATPQSAEDFQTILDKELHQLPARYRAPLVLCYLQGKTQDEAAQALGWTAGSVRGRLNRGRDILRRRLARRGVALSAVLFAAALAPPASAAPLPSLLLVTTVRSGLLFAAGPVEPGVLPATVLTLSEGVLHAMFIKKMQFTSLVLLVLGLVGAGAGWFAVPVLAEHFATAAAVVDGSTNAPSDGRFRKPTGVPGRVTKIEASRSPVAVTIALGNDEEDEDAAGANPQVVRVAFDLAKEAKVLVAGRPAELKDLKEGATVTLQLADDNRTVAAVHARGKIIDGTPGKIDAARNELTVRGDDDEEQGQPRTVAVLKDAAIYIDDFLAQLADLEDCAELQVELAADGQSVARVRGRWEKDGDIEGKVTAVDAALGTVTLQVEGEDDAQQEYKLKVGAATKLHINGVASKVADLKPGYRAKVRGKDGDQLTALRAVIRTATDDNDNDA